MLLSETFGFSTHQSTLKLAPIQRSTAIIRRIALDSPDYYNEDYRRLDTNDHQRIRFVARASYDGSRYHGWQDQGMNIVTVQSVITTSLLKRLGLSSSSNSIAICGASRTDQGVHALGQTFHFDVPAELAYTHILNTHNGCGDGSSDRSSGKSHHIKLTSRTLMHALTRHNNIKRHKRIYEPRSSGFQSTLSEKMSAKTTLNPFEYSWNKILPSDIRIYNVSLAPILTLDNVNTYTHTDRPISNQDLLGIKEKPRQLYLSHDQLFHASKSALSKKYVYRFTLNPLYDPRLHQLIPFFSCYRHFDMELFRFSLEQFIGSHDFSAFADGLESANTPRAPPSMSSVSEISPIRTVYSVKVIEEVDTITGKLTGSYRIEFHIKSALYRMVRNMVGTCVQVATGFMSLQEFLQLLASRGKKRSDNKAKAAPPQGLCLDHVYYENY